MGVLVELVLMLLLILLAAEVFVNALERMGERLGISEGVTGSLFAAVGTAMPETIVPVLAIFAGTADTAASHAIGVGAILGAPLMLSTLSLFLMGVSVMRQRGQQGLLRPEKTGLHRDLDFFLVAFLLAAIALYVPPGLAWGRAVVVILLIMAYLLYVMLTFKASARLVEEGHGTKADHPLLLTRLGLPDNPVVTGLQLLLGFGLLIAGAKGFIHGVEQAAPMIGITPLLLSLMIIPIATELPEKVNSILWIRRGKDTLAFGNITGAMVFQGTLLPALGIAATSWQPDKEVATSIAITFAAALWLRVMHARGQLRVWMLWVNGALYAAYLAIVLT